MNRNVLRFEVCKVAVLFVLMAIAAAAMAQTSLGTIAGVVTDPQGAVIQNATVTAVSNATGEKHVTTTNSLGAYRIESVGTGPYTITVKADKFSELKISNAVVTGSVTTTVNASLRVGAAETITVETTGEQLHTEDGAITHNISSAEIQAIPIGNLNPISLVLTEPGVIQPSGRESFTNGVGFSVNGSRPRANNFLIEGFDNNDAAIQGQALQVSNLEATKEVSIQTSSYTAEFGHGGGSVTNLVYKSGSNTWHGSVFDLIQNSTLNSNNASSKFNGSPKAKNRENTYGFTLGGPIKRDKIFVFGSIQWDKQRQGATGSPLTVPTDAGFAALQSIAAGNPRVTNYLAALGTLRASSAVGTPGLTTIATSGPGVQVARVQRLGIGEPSNDTQYVAKGDWQLSSNDTITIRYTYDKGDLTPDFFNFPNLLPCCDTQQGGTAHNGGLSYTHGFTSKVINEFRASYGRIGFSFDQTPATAANPVANGPTITIGGVSGFGTPANIPQGRFHNTYQYQDSVSWLVGNHSFKFGADIARVLVRDAIPFNSRGTLAYATGGSTGLANFIEDFGGSGGSANLTFGSPILRPRYFFQNYFVQDTWKLRSNLTLSLGVRYENAGTPENTMPFPAIDAALGASDPNFFTTGHPQKADSNNFAPRVSFAYTPHFWSSLFGRDKTVLRGGFGMFYDNIFTNIVDNTGASSPNAVSKSITSVVNATNLRGTPGLSGQFSALNPTPSQNVAVTSIVDNIIAPETYQWNFDIERELGAKFVLTTSYVGTRGVHLLVNDQFNPINPLTGLRVNPLRNSWTIRTNGGDSIYHALDVKLDRRFSKGLLLRTSYTFSKLIDTGSEVFTTTGNSSFPMNLSNRALDRGLSAFDRRHRVVVTYIYDIPKFRNDGNFGARALGHVVNGWQIAGTAAYQTGAPYTVSNGFDQNGDGTASDRPFLANASADPLAWAIVNPAGGFCDGATQLSRGICVPFLNGTWDQHGSANPLNWTGTAITASNIHWLVPAVGTGLGTLGRNTFSVPGRQDWTFGVQRNINLHSERHQLVVRMEMLNPFNHPNTGNPLSTNLSGVSFFNLPGSTVCSNLTTCPTTTTAGVPPAKNFQNTADTVTGERDIRFWLKYQF
jgi:hypothetical protein